MQLCWSVHLGVMHEEERIMKKWEYKIVDSKDVGGGGVFKGKERADVEAYLNELGRDGWKIINIDVKEFENRFDFSAVARRELTPRGYPGR